VAESPALTGVRIGPHIVHPRRLDLHRPGAGDHGPLGVEAVAYRQASVVFVTGIGQLGQVRVDLDLKSCGEHAPDAFADDLVAQGAVRRGAVDIDYG